MPEDTGFSILLTMPVLFKSFWKQTACRDTNTMEVPRYTNVTIQSCSREGTFMIF